MGKPLNDKQVRWIVRDEFMKIMDEISSNLMAANSTSKRTKEIKEEDYLPGPVLEGLAEDAKQGDPISREDIISALGKHGKEGALSILADFKVSRVGDLKPEDYADVMEVAKNYERKAS